MNGDPNELAAHRRWLNLWLLRVSIVLYLAFMLLGLVIFCIDDGAHAPVSARGSLLAILRGAAQSGAGLRAGAFLEAGLVVLLLTPIARLVAGIYLSARARDWLYVTIGAVVLGLVIVGLLAGQGG